MSADSTTKNPIFIVAVAIAAVLGIAAVFSVLPERMPPDPFEGEEPREVILEVTWTGDSPRSQNIFWEAGEERGTLVTQGETSDGQGGWHWFNRTIAYQGQLARVSAVQSAPGPVQCAIYVDELQVAVHEATDKAGCVTEATVA